jgi:hypothetical protein
MKTLVLMSKAVGAFIHTVAEFARSAPSNVWAMCAFVAAASIMVTVVPMYLWPSVVPEEAPQRETVDAVGVRRMARGGMSAPDIARRTGLSHDAVATILRAKDLPRRKSHPSAA